MRVSLGGILIFWKPLTNLLERFDGKFRLCCLFTGVHLCCGSCVDGVKGALDGIDGVSGIVCDQNTKIAGFKASDEEAAKKGIQALAE